MKAQVELFGNYVLLEKLASGGMAEIFLARPAAREGDGRLLVVKRVLPHFANHSEFLNMFQREIQIIMGFTHAHVVQLHDFGSVNFQPYIAMEYIEGKSLRDLGERLKASKAKMPTATALSLIAQAASGLHYAHTFENKTTGKPLNTIHRDISPHNLIVSFDGNLKVIDFGIAKAACSVIDLTKTGTVKGKAGYFSPEQLEGKILDARSDIFSLGVVAWELLTGEKLFAKPGDTEVSIMVKVGQCEKHVVPPSRFNKDIPVDVDRIILKALEKDPNNRFRDARQFQEELRKALMKYHPDHTYADTGEIVRNLFSEDIINHRRKTQELNQQAQEMLQEDAGEITAVIKVGGETDQTSTEKELELSKTREDVVALRLAKIESSLKQKASTRHYLLLAFYIISMIALKSGDLYHLWNDYMGTPRAAAEMITPVATSASSHRGSGHSSKKH